MNLFERFKKKRALKKSKQKFFKKRTKPFFFITSWGDSHPKVKRVLKIATLGVLPVGAIVIGTILGIQYANSERNPSFDSIVQLKDETVVRRVYLLSEDYDTIPLSVHLDKMNSIHEEILETFNLLKVDSVVTNEHLKGLIPAETRVLSFTLEDGLLALNLSEEFMNYKVPKEKLYSSITYTMLQFDEVNRVSIEVTDQLFSGILDQQMGINIVSSYGLSTTIGKELMTYYYSKTIGDTSYYVPVSMFVEKQEKDNLTFYKGLSYRHAASTGYRSLDLYKMLSKDQSPMDTMTFAVNKEALIEENLVNNDLYNLLLLSMDIMQKDTPVSFTLEGESVAVEGVIEEENYEVSSIVYNEVEI